MAYTDVYDQIDSRLNSVFSIHQYMPFPKKWDAITAGLPKLLPIGKHAVRMDGRMDVAAQAVYEEPLMDWILLLYNRVFGIGEDDVVSVQKTLNLTLLAGASQSFDLTIRHDLETDKSIFTYVDPVDDFTKTATIVYDTPGVSHVAIVGLTSPISPYHTIDFVQNESGSTTIYNKTIAKLSFQVTYYENVIDERLRAGQLLYYPDKDEVRKLLQEAIDVAQAETSGFARL